MAAKPVVVGVDGSQQSLLAAEWAAMEAVRRGLGLRIVSAPGIAPPMHSYHGSPETAIGVLRDVSARALGIASARAEEVAPGLEIAVDLLPGVPSLAVAGSGSDAAMLVVGARGSGGFAAMLLGSVSRYVADRGTCPVIVVRQASMAVHQQVAVGIHDPENASGALTFAFEEAAARHAGLVVVHAWSWFVPPLGGQADPGARSSPRHTPSRCPPRPPAACRPHWRHGGRSIPTYRSARTSLTAIPPASWLTIHPVPTWW